MSFGIGMYVRDTALKFGQYGVDMTKKMLNNISTNKTNYTGVYTPPGQNKNPFKISKIVCKKIQPNWFFFFFFFFFISYRYV